MEGKKDHVLDFFAFICKFDTMLAEYSIMKHVKLVHLHIDFFFLRSKYIRRIIKSLFNIPRKKFIKQNDELLWNI